MDDLYHGFILERLIILTRKNDCPIDLIHIAFVFISLNFIGEFLSNDKLQFIPLCCKIRTVGIINVEYQSQNAT